MTIPFPKGKKWPHWKQSELYSSQIALSALPRQGGVCAQDTGLVVENRWTWWSLPTLLILWSHKPWLHRTVTSGAAAKTPVALTCNTHLVPVNLVKHTQSSMGWTKTCEEERLNLKLVSIWSHSKALQSCKYPPSFCLHVKLSLTTQTTRQKLPKKQDAWMMLYVGYCIFLSFCTHIHLTISVVLHGLIPMMALPVRA